MSEMDLRFIIGKNFGSNEPLIRIEAFKDGEPLETLICLLATPQVNCAPFQAGELYNDDIISVRDFLNRLIYFPEKKENDDA
jgi:hypothetical protein